MFDNNQNYFDYSDYAKTIMTQKTQQRLVKHVFQYYRHKYNQHLGTDNSILLHEAFEFINLMNGKISPPKRHKTLITALTQAGKTFLVFAVSFVYNALGYVPVYIVKDRKQKNQFISRFITETNTLKNHLEDKCFSKETLSIFNTPLYYDSKTGNIKSFIKNLTSSLDGSFPRPIVCLWEHTHIQKVHNLITDSSKIALFIDEGHILGGIKQLSKFGNSCDLHTDKKYDNIISDLKMKSEKVFYITATPQDILMTEPELYTHGVVWLPKGHMYRGLENWKFNILSLEYQKEEKKTKHEIQVDFGHNITVPKSFFDTMYDLSCQTPIKRTNKFGIEDTHPINILAKFESINDRQHMLLKSFYPKDLPNSKYKKIIDSNWTALSFNQYGVRLFHTSLIGKKITIGNYTSINHGTGDFLFPNAEISEVYDYLAKNGGVNRFPRIVTFSYKSAEEGITFSSTWTDDVKTDSNWHLTHAYIRLGKNTSTSKAEQSAGRCSGNHGDNLPITIYCTLTDKKKLIKGYNLHDKQVQAICKLAQDEGDVKVSDYIRNLSIFNNHVPKKYYSIPKAITHLKKIKNPEADFEEQSLETLNKALSVLKIINPVRYNGETFRDNAKVIYEELEEELEDKETNLLVHKPTLSEIKQFGKEEYHRLLSMFKLWKSSNSKIANFMRNIGITTVYSTKTFNKICLKYKIEPSHLQKYNYGEGSKSNGYGKIIQKICEDNYRLHPVLCYAVRKYVQ